MKAFFCMYFTLLKAFLEWLIQALKVASFGTKLLFTFMTNEQKVVLEQCL